MERTALIVTCLKDLVLTIAVVVGGGWTLFTFNGALKRENAAAQLRKIEQEASLLERENIDLSIHHHALSVNNNPRGIAFRALTINTEPQKINLQLNERSQNNRGRSNISPDFSTLFHLGPVQLITELSPRWSTKGSKSQSL